MRILHVTPRYSERSGGDGLYAFHLSRALAAQGHEVFVCTLGETSFRLLTAQRYGDETVEELAPRRRDAWSENFYSVEAAKALQQAVAKARPDVIHVHSMHQYFTVAGVGVLRRAGRPVIWTQHDYKLVCGNSGFFSDRTSEPCTACLTGSVSHQLVRRCKKGSVLHSSAAALQMAMWKWSGMNDLIATVHAPSQYVGELLRQHPELAPKVRVLRHPLLAPPGPELDRSAEPEILYFGRMVPHKGAVLAAEAVQNVEVTVHMVGDGPERGQCERILSGRRNVIFHGWKRHDEIRALIRPGTIVILPYLAPETFCFAVVEAMMAGACVVTTPRGAIPELVQDGINGRMIDPKDGRSWAATIAELLAQPSERLRMASAARMIDDTLDPVGTHAAKMVDVYRAAAEGRIAHRPETLRDNTRKNAS
jgi:glycosyltransferase involved in cell wall biosynthesis